MSFFQNGTSVVLFIQMELCYTTLWDWIHRRNQCIERRSVSGGDGEGINQPEGLTAAAAELGTGTR